MVLISVLVDYVYLESNIQKISDFNKSDFIIEVIRWKTVGGQKKNPRFKAH